MNVTHRTRRLERLFFCLVSAIVLLALPARAVDPAKTVVQDTLYRADGTTAKGTILISWPAFSTADGKPVAAGTLSAKIGANGSVNIPLIPTQGATPSGTAYKVVISLDDGASSTEYWAVPNLSPTTIAAIRSTQVPTTVAMQVVSREYVDQQLASAVRKNGDETITGAKTFTSSPLVPSPGDAAAAANRGYVDTAIAAAAPTPSNVLNINKGGTGTNSFAASRCVRVADDGNSLESAGADCANANADTVDGLHATQLTNATSIQGVAVASTPPDRGALLSFDGAQYKPKRLWFSTADYSPLTVTVPTPAGAPVLTATVYVTQGSWLSGNEYSVACSYRGWSGETALSPTTTIVGDGRGAYVIDCPAPLGSRATGAALYVKNVTGNSAWQRASIYPPGTNDVPDLIQFGESVIGLPGVVASYFQFGATYAGNNDAREADGVTAIAAPASAPSARRISDLPANTTFFGCYTYLAGDNTETACSPVSASATTGASGGYLKFRIPQAPPSGAVQTCLYLGTSNVASQMHRQKCVPLHHVTAQVHAYDAAGAAPSAGAAQSTISEVQQAWDAAIAAGGGKVVMPAGSVNFVVPIILRARTYPSGALVTGGVSFECLGATDANGGGSCALNYTGSTVGVEGIVSTAYDSHIRGLQQADPNRRVGFGLAMADFSNESFQNHWDDVTFIANASSGVGFIVDTFSANQSSHTASEQWFDGVTFGGGAWAVELHGAQTADIRMWKANFSGGADSGRNANSGEIRLFQTPLWIDGFQFVGNGHYGFLLSGDPSDPNHGGMAFLDARGGYDEMYSTTQYLSISSMSNGVWNATVRSSRSTNHTNHRIFAVNANADARIVFDNPQSHGGDCLLNYPKNLSIGSSYYNSSGAPGLLVQGNWNGVCAGGSYKSVAPDYGSNPLLVAANGPLRLLNENGAASDILTNATGDMVLKPSADVLLKADPTVPLGAVTKQYVDTRLAGLGATSYFTWTTAVSQQLDWAATYNQFTMPANGHLVRWEVWTTTPANGCSTFAVVTITDDTTSQDITLSALQNYRDSGAINLAFAQGAKIKAKVKTAQSGCSQKANAPINFTATFSVP